MRRLSFFAFALLLPLSGHAMVQGLQSPTLVIERPWVAAAPVGSSAALNMVVRNTTSGTIWIEKAETPVAGQVVFQAYKTENGLEIIQLPKLQIPAGGRLTMTPETFELLLVRLNMRLDEGLEIPLTLKLSNGAVQTLRVPIKDGSMMRDNDSQ